MQTAALRIILLDREESILMDLSNISIRSTSANFLLEWCKDILSIRETEEAERSILEIYYFLRITKIVWDYV